MSAFVVDTNVPVVANGRSKQASADCVLSCIDALRHVVVDGLIVLDDKMRILSEYMDNLSMSGQPGAGDYFMKWVWSVQAVSERCEQAVIHETPDDDRGFEKFPPDPALAKFDRSDRKFVAVALASKNEPTVLNAVDPDWWEHRKALRKNGLWIKFLCPDAMDKTG